MKLKALLVVKCLVALCFGIPILVVPDNYRGPAIFTNFNPEMTDDSYVEKFPYVITREVILRSVTIASGMPMRLSDNLYMFRNVKVSSE